MKKRYYNQMKKFIAVVLVCVLCLGLIPASLPETVHAAAVSAAEQKKWYEVTAKISSSWGGHIAGEITLTNNSEETIQDWQIEFPWDALITSMWGGNYEPTENGYIITPADYNRELAAGASVSIGFMAEGEDAVLEELVTEGFFEDYGVHITTAEERENMPPEPSREPAPTLEATVSPTPEPTVEPTATPTLAPEPTATPMPEPTTSPTVEPTTTPTLAPTATVSPTHAPTATPTLEPTATPTLEPTASPTFAPTPMVTPTLGPTASPTLEATATPTIAPTASPTLEPTATPTPELTATPTLEPTASPTLAPTATPTQEPTATPTLEPTASPTTVPTAEPTEEPTAEPVEDFYVYTDTTLTEDLTCRNLFLMGGALTVKDCTITVQEDYLQTEKNCTLQNGTMDIQGNAHVAAGTLSLARQSRADIGGNLRIAGDGRLYADNYTTTEIRVAKDLIIDSQAKTELIAGSLTLGGNLIQTEDSGEDSLSVGNSFYLYFQGEKRQKIQLAHPSATPLGNMDFRESAGIDAPDELHGTQILGFAKLGKKEHLDLYLTQVTLQQDETIHCADVNWHGGGVNIASHHLKTEGKLTMLLSSSLSGKKGKFTVQGDWKYRSESSSSADFTDSELQVEGDFYCKLSKIYAFWLTNSSMRVSGNVDIEGGRLSLARQSRAGIGGNLRIAGDGRLYADNYTTTEIRVAKDLVIDSQAKTELIAGGLTLGGDLIQTEDSAEDSLSVRDSFYLHFQGEKRQKIQLAHLSSTSLGNMDFRESAGIDAPDELHGTQILDFAKLGKKEHLDLYLTQVTLQQDETIHCADVDWHGGGVNIASYHLKTEGKLAMLLSSSLSGKKGKLTVRGDWKYRSESSSSADFADSELQVEGDFYCKLSKIYAFWLTNSSMWVSGNVDIEGGRLSLARQSRASIGGNLRITGEGRAYEDNYTTTEIRVAKDFIIDSQEKTELVAGSLTLGGDLLQTEDSAEDSLEIGSGFNLILNGKEEQTIFLWDEEAVLGSLDLSGCTSLLYDGEFYGSEIRGIERISDTYEIVSHCMRNIVTSNGSIAEDLYIDGELSFEEGASLTLGADFYHDGALNMGGGTLKVKGDYDAESSVVDVTDGSLMVEGDMHVKSDASLSLKTPKSHLDVRGDLNISSMQVTGNQMTDGVIRIGGDINCSEYASTESFSLNGTKLVLNGTEPQEVVIRYDPDRTPYEIDITESAGVNFWNSIIRAKSIKGFDKIQNKSIIIEDLQQNLEQDEVFHGDLMIDGKSLNLAGRDFVVEGDLDLIDTILCPNEGLLETGGNYSMCGSSSLVMLHTVDRMQIGGDFRTYSGVDHTNLLQRGRIGLYGNFYQYGNEYAFNSEQDLLVAFMGNYTHYYWFTNHDHSQFSITYGKAEELDWDQEIDPTILNAIFYGMKAGLRELSDSPDEVLAAAAMGAAVGLGITLASASIPGTMAFAGIIGIYFTICEFYEDYEHISSIEGSYEQIREAAKLVTIFIVTSFAAWLGGKVGIAAGSAASGKVHEISSAVENEIKNPKIWKSTCEWMKENVLENAKAFTNDVKNLLNEAVVGKIKGWLDNSKALQLYKYQTLTVDDILPELAGILDQDACSYLRRNCSGPKDIKKLRKISVCSVFAEKAKGCKLNKFDIQYIDSVFATLSQEEINRTVSFLENAVSDQIVAENSGALEFFKNIYQQKSHFNRIHKIFDSARQAAEIKGGPLTEVEARYINRTYADSGKQKIPQREIDSYFKIISKGYDVSDLKNVGSQFDQDTLEHIFAGQLKGKTKGKVEAVGYHYVGEHDTAGSIIPGTKTPKNKFGGYEAEVKVAGIKKRDISSFYPDSMSRQDVVDVINQAYANMTLQPEGHYIGTAMYQGNKMTIVIRLKPNGKIETAYPKY